jgi:hypothetical protein
MGITRSRFNKNATTVALTIIDIPMIDNSPSKKTTPPVALAIAQNYLRNITLGELQQSVLGRSIITELQQDDLRVLAPDTPDHTKPLSDLTSGQHGSAKAGPINNNLPSNQQNLAGRLRSVSFAESLH